MKEEELLLMLKQVISAETGIMIPEIKDTDTFHDLGLDSVSGVFILDKLEKRLKAELNPIYLWDYPTVRQFAQFLVTLKL